MDFPANVELVDKGDLDELIRHVDRLAAAGDWDGLEDLRHRARRAFHERGRQLWPVATRAEYRLALDAPGPWAAAVVVDGAGHLGPGPLAEVAATTHAWEDLAPHLPPGPAAAWCAHERVARGDDLRGDERIPAGGPELPLVRSGWEPAYHAPEYSLEGLTEVTWPVVSGSPLPARESGVTAAQVSNAELEPSRQALLDVTQAWRRDSNGHARAVAVEGDIVDALGALDVATPLLEQISLSDALDRIAAAAASGGAHGRRSGLARGRFEAWWVAATLVALEDPWPPDPDELGEALGELRWWSWRPSDRPDVGWTLRLAIEDPLDGVAWALDATDHS